MKLTTASARHPEKLETDGVKVRSPSLLVCLPYTSYEKTVTEALDALNAPEILRLQRKIVIKPNLVQSSPFPVTTPPECVGAIVEYCRRNATAEVYIAEGSGGGDTMEVFHDLGYQELSREYRVTLVDLDEEPVMHLHNEKCKLLRDFYLPQILRDGFLISVPVLKAHSMSKVTLSLKNMIGVAPASRYKASAFRKSRLHGKNNGQLHQYIVDLNCYRKPDLTVIDATVGMAEAHLWGPPCDPPVNRIVAAYDPVAADAKGSQLLGIDWKTVEHISLANGLLGKVCDEGLYETE
jgi:uncharacterized protein (DUF362 family)